MNTNVTITIAPKNRRNRRLSARRVSVPDGAMRITSLRIS
jgi:hypothetical protein